MLWADYETMRDIGGPINLEDSRKEVWYQKMVKPTDGKNFFCLIYNNEDTPVGEVSFHKFESKDGKLSKLQINTVEMAMQKKQLL